MTRFGREANLRRLSANIFLSLASGLSDREMLMRRRKGAAGTSASGMDPAQTPSPRADRHTDRPGSINSCLRYPRPTSAHPLDASLAHSFDSCRRRRHASLAAVARVGAETFHGAARWRHVTRQDRAAGHAAARRLDIGDDHQPFLLPARSGRLHGPRCRCAKRTRLSSRALRPQYRAGHRAGRNLGTGSGIRRQRAPGVALRPSDPRPRRVRESGHRRSRIGAARTPRHLRDRADAPGHGIRLHRMRRRTWRCVRSEFRRCASRVVSSRSPHWRRRRNMLRPEITSGTPACSRSRRARFWRRSPAMRRR